MSNSNPQPPVDRVTVTVDKQVVCRVTRNHRVLVAKNMTKDQMREALETLAGGLSDMLRITEQFVGAFVGDRAPTPGCTCPSCGLIMFYQQLQEPHLH